MRLIGITRVRNEELILEDTINHYLDLGIEAIYLYDDCSTDRTVEIARSFPQVFVTEGDKWRRNRVAENTRHRHLMLEQAREDGAEWCLCFDADERLVGDLPPLGGGPVAYQFRLFDGYLTENRQDEYEAGGLENLPRMWGPEFRDIVILYKIAAARYNKPGQRQPTIDGRVDLAPVFVKHYGKCLSVQHWEDTCNYYAAHFPRKFSKTWEARRGKAIHTRSDFNRPLFTWAQLMENVNQWHKIG